eukprot:1634416-Amphidinium_carterae.2
MPQGGHALCRDECCHFTQCDLRLRHFAARDLQPGKLEPEAANTSAKRYRNEGKKQEEVNTVGIALDVATAVTALPRRVLDYDAVLLRRHQRTMEAATKLGSRLVAYTCRLDLVMPAVRTNPSVIAERPVDLCSDPQKRASVRAPCPTQAL